MYLVSAKMFLKIFIVSLLFVYSFQQNYDEDINRPYPVTIYNRQTNVHSPQEVQNLENMYNCSCKVLAELDTHCSGTRCTIFPSHINTSAKYFKLKLTSVTTIKRDDFLLLGNVKAMDINANVKLNTIEAGCFRKMSNLKNLSLVANINLKYLPKNVFEGLKNVEQMFFQKNGFIEIKDVTNSLSILFVPMLQLLDLSESMFYKINYDDFHAMNGSTVTQLNLILCELETVHPDALIPLKKLSKLLLGQNNFNISTLSNLIVNSTKANIPINYLSLYDIGIRRNIPNELMNAIATSNISSLSLANNHFDNIDDKDFPYMPHIIDLDLRQTYIEDITENAFKKLTNLKILRLGENKLFSVPKGALIPQITYLDLAGNTIIGVYFSMQDAIYSKMLHLESLQLSYNLICTLNNQSFIGLINLKKLNLKKTGLHHIDDYTFAPLKKLLQLNLMDNPLSTNLNAKTFIGLSKLEVLLLGECNINNLTIYPNIFTYLKSLKYLGLEKTNIHTISSNQFYQLKNLQTLNLADNKLGSWSKQILPKNLKYFFAQQNKISYLTTAMLEDWKNLTAFYLDENPFTCDCTFYPTLIWLNKEGISLENFVEKEEMIARCIFPENWRQKSVVEYIKYLNHTGQCIQYNESEIYLEIVFVTIILFVIIILLCCLYKKYYHTQKTMYDCKI